MASSTTPSSGAGCVSNCGTPRFFCDTGGWAFCDDYRDLFCPVTDTVFGPTNCTFPDPSRVGHLTTTILSTTDPDYLPHVDGKLQEAGWFANDQEHIHSEMIDGNFGLAILRQHQPFDFTGRTGHIHLEIDLKTESRRYVSVMVSPDLVKSETDDRSCGDNGCTRQPQNAIDIWFRGGPPQPGGAGGGGCIIQSSRNGATLTETDCAQDYHGMDNIRNLVDLYISSTHVRIVVDGVQIANTDIEYPGFTQGYVYLTQRSYNPGKDGQDARNLNIFHWDDLSFDGPVLPENGLTPAGFEDVVFNVFRTNSCTVLGQPAKAAKNTDTQGSWVTYTARFPIGTVVTKADVNCNFYANNNRDVMGWEIVHQ